MIKYILLRKTLKYQLEKWKPIITKLKKNWIVHKHQWMLLRV